MTKASAFAAIIFDMDGLVLDTESGYCQAWQQAAKHMGFELSEPFCQSLSGLHGKQITEKLQTQSSEDLDINAFMATASSLWRAHVQSHGIAVKAGFHELLAFIQQQNIPFALATNSRRDNALECLSLAGLQQQFPLIISRDDVVHGKPDPAIFLTAAAQLNTPIHQCLILEDSHVGILAAHRAGAVTVLIPSSPPITAATLPYCNHIMDDLHAVLAFLTGLQPNQSITP